MIITRFQCTDADAAFIGAARSLGGGNSVPLQVEWADAYTDAVYGQWVQLRQFCHSSDLKYWSLFGKLPTGDRFKDWKSSDFRQHVPATEGI